MDGGTQGAGSGAADATPRGDGPSLTGAYAAIFDLIAHEYGWTDEHILDLPLCRLRQVVDALRRRRVSEQLERIRLTEWETRVTCSFIAAQAGLWMDLKQGQANPMMNAALAISIMPEEKTPEEQALDEMRGEKVADRVEDDPRFSMVMADPVKGVEASNPAGSYEALLGGWGKHPSHGQAFDTTAVREG